jgi:AhpD family alkylhydroperoxidase
VLNPADRELVGIGASIGAGCQPCLEYHLDAGSRTGLGESDLLKAIEDAECVRRSASGQLSALGRRRLGQPAEVPADCCDTSDRAKELAAVGAAVAANSQANLEKHVNAARLVGLGTGELEEAFRLARAVQRRSAEILAEEATRLLARPEPPVVETLLASAGCGLDCGCADTPVASSTSVVDVVSSSAGCGPECTCGPDTSAVPAGSELPLLGAVTAAAMVAVPTAFSCDCG